MVQEHRLPQTASPLKALKMKIALTSLSLTWVYLFTFFGFIFQRWRGDGTEWFEVHKRVIDRSVETWFTSPCIPFPNPSSSPGSGQVGGNLYLHTRVSLNSQSYGKFLGTSRQLLLQSLCYFIISSSSGDVVNMVGSDSISWFWPFSYQFSGRTFLEPNFWYKGKLI